MRLRALAAAIVFVPALVALAACSSTGLTQSAASQSDTSSSPSSGEAAGSGEASSAPDSAAPDTAQPAGPEVPADTEVAAPVDRGLMPEASGSLGDKPTITMPSTPAPDSLQRVILDEGDGPTSKAGDTLVVDYLGQVWGGDVFDNSYDRGQPFSVQVGGPQRQVVAGWDVGLQGVKEGSRVLLSFPSRDGYGMKGSPPKIAGGASLVFVVDVLAVYASDMTGDPDATPQQIPAGWPTVEGDLGAVPTVTIPDSLPEPTTPDFTVVAKGHGDPVQSGTVMVQYVVTSWDGTHVEQSWPDPTGSNPLSGAGLQSFPVAEGTPYAGLAGVPMGSRVLLRTPANTDAGMPAAAWVIDLVAQESTAPPSS